MGSQDSKSSSAPVTADQRLETYNTGVEAMNPHFANYEAPNIERLDTDYGKLQSDLTSGYTAPIDRAKIIDMKRNDQAMADRGIYTSMNAIKSNNDVSERYIPQYAMAGANATNQRYALQAQDIAGANANKLTIADKQYESKWRPEDYKAGLWNGTGGTISSGTSGGWSI